MDRNWVYLIRSLSAPDQRYVGVTSDLDARLQTHKAECARQTTPPSTFQSVGMSIEAASPPMPCGSMRLYLRKRRILPSPATSATEATRKTPSTAETRRIMTLPPFQSARGADIGVSVPLEPNCGRVEKFRQAQSFRCCSCRDGGLLAERFHLGPNLGT
ncbi:MAG TPA: GIY-YIG nuclease family protein [Candidatus Binatia bacterium]